jgi:hypothetical protein
VFRSARWSTTRHLRVQADRLAPHIRLSPGDRDRRYKALLFIHAPDRLLRAELAEMMRFLRHLVPQRMPPADFANWFWPQGDGAR